MDMKKKAGAIGGVGEREVQPAHIAARREFQVITKQMTLLATRAASFDAGERGITRFAV